MVDGPRKQNKGDKMRFVRNVILLKKEDFQELWNTLQMDVELLLEDLTNDKSIHIKITGEVIENNKKEVKKDNGRERI